MNNLIKNDITENQIFSRVYIKKYNEPLNNKFNYNVQVYYSTDNQNFYYAGTGKFCRTLKEAKKYKSKIKHNKI